MTFTQQLSKLPEKTLIYPGHDYISNNLKFTLDREPDNIKAQSLLKKISKQNEENAFVSNLGLEKEVNTFFRLHNPNIIIRLKKIFPDLSDHPNPKEVFIKLRELRNSW